MPRILVRSIDAVNARLKDVDDLHDSLAREFKVHICAATAPVRRENRQPVNRARFFAPDGTHEVQDKLMLTDFERDEWGIVPGGPARVFETALGRIGILIGTDAAFPLIAHAMALAGAEVLLVPSRSETLQAYCRVRVAAMARALENRCIVVHATTVGDTDWLPLATPNHGVAAIYGPADLGFPDDGLIAVGKLDTPGWVHGEVALAAVQQARNEGADPGFRDWADQTARIGTVEMVSLGAV